jgi:RimJ/RimL family protein N-acetyltransferase
VIAQQDNDAPVPIGIIGFANVDMRNRSAEYWIYLGEPTAQRQGIATRASVRMLEFGFDTIGLHRIYLSVLKTNASAIGLYEKLGFIREGISREQAFALGRFWLIQYSLLDEEFRQRYASMVAIV